MDFTFGKPASKKIKPLLAQLQYWSEACEVGDKYPQDAQKKVMPTKLVTLYTGDNDAKPFQSHQKDPELADLKFADKLAAEKTYKTARRTLWGFWICWNLSND